MTREEEIQKLIDEEMGIDNYGSLDFQVGVNYGVKLADKTMIEKVCKWFKNNWREYVYQDKDGIVSFAHWESDFRKAMEEQRISRYKNKTNRRYGKMRYEPGDIVRIKSINNKKKII